MTLHGDVKQIHRWVTDGTGLQTGRGFVRSIQVRSGSLYTAGRACRGRKGADPRCHTCGTYESLGHILQKCAKTWEARNTRHDAVVQIVRKELEKVGYQVVTEPNIPSRAGIRKPDLVVWRGGDAMVTDVTIVTDDACLDRTHDLKVLHYDKTEIRDYVSQLTGVPSSDVKFSGLAFNWRGALSRKSFDDIREFGLPVSAIQLASVVVLEKGYDAYRHHRRTTGV